MHSRSDDPLNDVLRTATERIRDAVIAVGTANPVVVIDGRSGAGKTSLAARVVATWPLPAPVQLLALDAVYPGWEGLAEGARMVCERVLVPHRAGQVGTWHRWDWERDLPAEAHTIDPARALIVEGCGALTAESAPLAGVSVWVDGPAASRKQRALERDGDTFRPHWAMWAAQEDAHIAAHDPQRLAMITVLVP